MSFLWELDSVWPVGFSRVCVCVQWWSNDETLKQSIPRACSVWLVGLSRFMILCPVSSHHLLIVRVLKHRTSSMCFSWGFLWSCFAGCWSWGCGTNISVWCGIDFVHVQIWQFITSSASFQTRRTEIALCKSLLGNSTTLGHICLCKIPLSRETKDKEGCSLVAGTSSSSWSQWCQTGFLDWANGAKQDSRLSQDSSVLLESTFLSSESPKRLKPTNFYRVWTMMCHQWLPISWHVEHVNQ